MELNKRSTKGSKKTKSKKQSQRYNKHSKSKTNKMKNKIKDTTHKVPIIPQMYPTQPLNQHTEFNSNVKIPLPPSPTQSFAYSMNSFNNNLTSTLGTDTVNNQQMTHLDNGLNMNGMFDLPSTQPQSQRHNVHQTGYQSMFDMMLGQHPRALSNVHTQGDVLMRDPLFDDMVEDDDVIDSIFKDYGAIKCGRNLKVFEDFMQLTTGCTFRLDTSNDGQEYDSTKFFFMNILNCMDKVKQFVFQKLTIKKCPIEVYVKNEDFLLKLLIDFVVKPIAHIVEELSVQICKFILVNFLVFLTLHKSLCNQ